MAKKTVVITNVHCDMCEGEVEATHSDITFGYGKKSGELDLCDKHFGPLDEMLSTYLAQARKPSTGGQATLPGMAARRSSSSGGSRDEAKRIKEWAAKQGIDVPAMGRIPQQVKEQYRQAVRA